MENIKKNMRIKKANKIITILNENDYEGVYANSLEEAKEMILNLIPKSLSIGLGGSATINVMGLVEIFRTGEYSLYDRYNQPDWPMTVESMRQAMLADYFVTGTNAITENGELVQMDSGGNRVASLVYGPKNVIVVTGVNKVVKNVCDALERIKNHAAPLNSKRMNHKTPCNITGFCENCTTKQRICNYTSIIKNGMRMGKKIIVIVISEEVGY